MDQKIQVGLLDKAADCHSGIPRWDSGPLHQKGLESKAAMRKNLSFATVYKWL